MKQNEPTPPPSKLPYLLALGAMVSLIIYAFVAITTRGPAGTVAEGKAQDSALAEADSATLTKGAAKATPKPAVMRALNSPLSDIQLSFKLDPRLTRGLYMGDRWVSPPIYARVGEGPQCSMELKAQGIDTRGKPMDISPRWTSADPDLATISADGGKEIKISVQRPGQTTIEVAALGFSKELPLNATAYGDTLMVELSQPVVQRLELAQTSANQEPAVAQVPPTNVDPKTQSERQLAPVQRRRGHHRAPMQITSVAETAKGMETDLQALREQLKASLPEDAAGMETYLEAVHQQLKDLSAGQADNLQGGDE